MVAKELSTRWWNVWLRQLTSLLKLGAEKDLVLDDMLNIPLHLHPEQCRIALFEASSRVYINRCEDYDTYKAKLVFTLVRKVYGWDILRVGVIKLITVLLNYTGPLLIGAMVSFIESGKSDNDDKTDDLSTNSGNFLVYTPSLDWTGGLTLVGLFALSFTLSAIMNTMYSVQISYLQARIKGSLTTCVFERLLSFSAIERGGEGKGKGARTTANANANNSHSLNSKHDQSRSSASRNITDSLALNLFQVDIDRVAALVQSVHDLWALPLQILLSFYLLYLQLDVAFLTGVVIIGIMIPVNTYIASIIQAATKAMMVSKDERMKILTEAMRGVKTVKMLGLESTIAALSWVLRRSEVKYLATRKYCDAVCVLLWASMPVIVPYATFTTCVALGRDLTSQDVFTSLALLAMLITPMNSLPWVVNGFIEGRVSAGRVGGVFCRGIGDIANDAASDTSSSRSGGGGGGGGGKDQKFKGSGGSRSDAYVRAPIDRRTRNGRVQLHNTIISWDPILSSPTVTGAEAESNSEEQALLPSSVRNSNSSSSSASKSQSQSQMHMQSLRVGPVSLVVEKGELVCICGKVGSGKTSLLRAILDDIYKYTSPASSSSFGSNAYSSSSNSSSSELRPRLEQSNPSDALCAGYCPQAPQMFQASVRDNITFGCPFDQHRYEICIRGCALNVDIDEWADGDSHLCGQDGSALSGGQRLRVGVARAVYATCAFVCVDDPTSALDPITASKILSFLYWISQDSDQRKGEGKPCGTLPFFSSLGFSGDGGLTGRAVVMTAHSSDTLIAAASATAAALRPTTAPTSAGIGEVRVVTIGDRGQVSTKALTLTAPASTPVLKSTRLWGDAATTSASGGEPSEPDNVDISTTSGTGTGTGTGTGAAVGAGDGEVGDEEEEGVFVGVIKSRYIWHYIKAAGIPICATVIASIATMQASAILMGYFYGSWASNPDKYSDGQFYEITSIIMSVNFVAAIIRSFSFAWACMRACVSLYSELINSVLYAPLGWFENTSVGRVVNRLGRDVFIVDDQLPFMLNIVIMQFFLVAGGFTIIIVSDVVVLPFMLFAFYLYFRIQRFFRHSSRQLRRLDSVVRSPMYSLLSDSFAATPVIRAHPSASRHYCDVLDGMMRDVLRVSLCSDLCSQWLSIRLQILGMFISCIISLSAVVCTLEHDLCLVETSPALLGLALLYSISIVSNLNGLLGSVTATEQHFVSVERVCEYIEDLGPGRPDHDNKKPATTATTGSGSGSGTTLGGGVRDSGGLSLKEPSAWFASIVSGDDANDGDLERPLLSDLTEVDISLFSGAEQGLRCEPEDGEIFFNDISLSYSHSDLLKQTQSLTGKSSSPRPTASLALRNVTLRVPIGARVAVVGRTGSGKSSMLRCVMGLTRISQGALYVSGDLCNYPVPVDEGGGNSSGSSSSRQQLQQIAVLPQDPVLLSGTIALNIDPWTPGDTQSTQKGTRTGDLEDVGVVDREDIDAVHRERYALMARCLVDSGFVDTIRARQTDKQVDVLIDATTTAATTTTTAATTPTSAATTTTTTTSSATTTSATTGAIDLEYLSDMAPIEMLRVTLEDGGSQLSAGQRQLLCLARTIYKIRSYTAESGKGCVVLIDEATSNLDEFAELKIIRTLRDVCIEKRCTLLCVTHNLESATRTDAIGGTTPLCEWVLTMDAGRVKSFAKL